MSSGAGVLANVRERATMYSVATATLCGVFAVLLLADTLLDGGPRLGVPLTIVVMVLSVIGAIGFLLLGDRFGL